MLNGPVGLDPVLLPARLGELAERAAGDKEVGGEGVGEPLLGIPITLSRYHTHGRVMEERVRKLMHHGEGLTAGAVSALTRMLYPSFG